MLKNNQFTSDTDGERLERLQLLSANIDTHAVELEIIGDKLLRCQTGGADWNSAVVNAGVEDGESQEATETLDQALLAAHDYYVAAKEHLLSIIYDIGEPDEIIEEYAVKGDAPWNYNGLFIKFNKWLETDTRLKALVPPDPRVVGATVIANLTTHRDTINTLWHDAQEERREKSEAYAAKRELFDKQSSLLTFVLGAAKLVWGNDDPRLRDLGCVPKSEIWTPGQPEPPEPGGATYPDPVENLKAENITTPIIVNKVSWDVLAGANSYSVKKAEVDIGQIAPPMPEEYYAQDYIDNTPVGDNDIMPGKTYYYWVCGVDETGVEGEWAICSCDYV